MKYKIIAALAAVFLSTSAFATKPKPGNNEQKQAQGQLQGQAQGQHQGQSSKNSNSNRNHNAATSGSQSASAAISGAASHSGAKASNAVDASSAAVVGVKTGDTSAAGGTASTDGTVTDNSSVSVEGDQISYEAADIPAQTAYAGPASQCVQTAGAQGVKFGISFSRTPKICQHLMMADQYVIMAQAVAAACNGAGCGQKVDTLMDTAFEHMNAASEALLKKHRKNQ